MNKKTCSKSFQYSARANIPPDDTFLKEIKEIKQQAEQGFVSALTRYHKRRLESQENKFKKTSSLKTVATASNSVNESTREQSHSANTENIANYDVTRRIFAFTRALCLGETLVLLDVVSQHVAYIVT